MVINIGECSLIVREEWINIVRSSKTRATIIRKFQTKVTELKNTLTKLKNTTEGLNSRLDEGKVWISELEGKET